MAGFCPAVGEILRPPFRLAWRLSVSITLTTRNITRVFRSGTDSQREAGIAWYGIAWQFCLAMDPDNPVRCAAVTAVLSQQRNWTLNVALVRKAYARWHAGEPIAAGLGHMGAINRKVERILLGEDPSNVVSGDKVVSFFRSIVNPADPDLVVIDRHAFDIAAGRVTDNATRGAYLGRPGNYEAVSDLYRRAARILSRDYGMTITPIMVQAVTWVVWRETNVRTKSANRRERLAAITA